MGGFCLLITYLFNLRFYEIFSGGSIDWFILIFSFTHLIVFLVIMFFVRNRKSITFMLIYYTLYNLFYPTLSLVVGKYLDRGEVPLLGLEEITNDLITEFIWPVLGTVLAIILIPRIFAPLYLKIKGKSRIIYADINSHEKIVFKKLIFRTFLIYLFGYGLAKSLITSNIVNMFLFFPYSIHGNIEVGSEIYIAEPLIIFILPITVAIWSIGWTLEDANLYYYKISKEKSKTTYDIEPLHFKYNSLLKGFAGLSSIFILYDVIVKVLLYIFTEAPTQSYFDLFLALVTNLAYMFTMVAALLPAYILYCKFNKKYLHSGLQKDSDCFEVIEKDLRLT